MERTHNLRFTHPNRALEDTMPHKVYRLSPSYTKPANPYLIMNANTLPATWVAHKTFMSCFSVIGPSLTRNQLRMVRFVASRIWPVLGCFVRRVRPRSESS